MQSHRSRNRSSIYANRVRSVNPIQADRGEISHSQRLTIYIFILEFAYNPHRSDVHAARKHTSQSGIVRIFEFSVGAEKKNGYAMYVFAVHLHCTVTKSALG